MKMFLALLAATFVAVAPARAAESTPVDTVKALYEAHRPAIEGNGDGVLYDDALRDRFLAADLSAAIKKDSDEAERNEQVGALDFDPITDSQDPVVKNLKIEAGTETPDKATVIASFSRGDDSQPVSITYTLVRESDSWKVWDIGNDKPTGDEEKWSVRQLLKIP